MKIAVIGSTGYVGNAVVQELAGRGHEVTAFARNTDKVFQAQNVAAVSADVNAADFADKLAGFDAVVSAFNPGWTNPNIGADFTRGANSIVEAAKVAQVPYLLIVGGAGSLYAARHLLTALLPRRDVNWSFVSPPARLGADGGFSEDKTGKYRLGKDDLLMDGEIPAGISVADLAIAIADDVENKAHLFERFTVAAT